MMIADKKKMNFYTHSMHLFFTGRMPFLPPSQQRQSTEGCQSTEGSWCCRYPVILQQFSLKRGSGGSGRYSGGDGVIREMLFRKSLTLSVLSERRTHRPYGLCGSDALIVCRFLLWIAFIALIAFSASNCFRLSVYALDCLQCFELLVCVCACVRPCLFMNVYE